jgi:hypothetical protein
MGLKPLYHTSGNLDIYPIVPPAHQVNHLINKGVQPMCQDFSRDRQRSSRISVDNIMVSFLTIERGSHQGFIAGYAGGTNADGQYFKFIFRKNPWQFY